MRRAYKNLGGMTQHTSSRELTRRILFGEGGIIRRIKGGYRTARQVTNESEDVVKIPYIKNGVRLCGGGD